MTPQPPHCDHECVCSRYYDPEWDIERDTKPCCIDANCAYDTRSRPAPSTERIGSIRTNIFMDEQKEWLIERVNAGMGEWEYVISYLGEYFATAPSELIAREIQEAYSDRATIAAKAREDVLDNITKFVCAYEDFIGMDNIDGFEIYGVRSVNLKEHIESLRTGGERR